LSGAAELVVEDDFTRVFEKVAAADELYFGSVLRMKGFDLEEMLLRRDIAKVN
jgi:hypothetical protein